MLYVLPTAHAHPMVGTDDLGRVLSDDGIKRAQERAKEFSFVEVERVLTSPVIRCRQTAQIIFPGREYDVVEELYVPTELRNLFNARTATLHEYIEDDATGQVLYWAWNAMMGIHRELRRRKAMNIGIIGHAGFSDVIGAVLFPEHAEELSNLILHKAGGISITPRGLMLHES